MLPDTHRVVLDAGNSTKREALKALEGEVLHAARESRIPAYVS